ncbi:MAG: hypothetical protein K8I02_06580, partial [Candidatus Methylomirabilis sp.]|nr:hypothetical protein [Deltaproteobacteria bacterium]
LMGTTERVSVDSTGAQGIRPSYLMGISADGRFVAMDSASENFYPPGTAPEFPFLLLQVFIHDRATGRTEIASVNAYGIPGNAHSGDQTYGNALSGDGRFVAFSSDATNLVVGDTNDRSDVFRAPNPLFWDAPAPVPPLDVN